MQQPALQSDLPQGFAAMVLPTHAMHARQFGLLGSGLLIVQSALQEGFAPSTYDVLVEMRGILADGMGDTSLMLRECELVFSPPGRRKREEATEAGTQLGQAGPSSAASDQR